MSTSAVQISKQSPADDAKASSNSPAPASRDQSAKAEPRAKREPRSRQPRKPRAQEPKKTEKTEMTAAEKEAKEAGQTDLVLISSKPIYVYLNLVKTLLHTKYETVQMRGVNDQGNNQVARIASLLKKLGYVELQSISTTHRPRQHSISVVVKKTAQFGTLFDEHQAVVLERREKARAEREQKEEDRTTGKKASDSPKKEAAADDEKLAESLA